MFSFSQPVSPVVRAHLDAQAAFFEALSRSLTGSFQNVFQANLQLSQSMLEDTLSASKHMLASPGSKGILEAAASQAQPAADRLRAYQQHLSRLAADSQVDLTRITQEHVQHTSRTVHAMAEEVTRVAGEETERNKQRQQEAAKAFRNPFADDGAPNGKARANNPSPQRDGASLQADGAAGEASFAGNRQGQPQAPDAARKGTGKPA
jgi:phasin family protein